MSLEMSLASSFSADSGPLVLGEIRQREPKSWSCARGKRRLFDHARTDRGRAASLDAITRAVTGLEPLGSVAVMLKVFVPFCTGAVPRKWSPEVTAVVCPWIVTDAGSLTPPQSATALETFGDPSAEGDPYHVRLIAWRVQAQGR